MSTESASPPQPGDRARALAAWAGACLGSAPPSLEPLIVEASSRRFYRLRTADGRLIAIDAPPQTENTGQYLAIATAWSAAGLAVPRIHFADAAAGFLLVDDLGDITLDDRLRAAPADADAVYGRALQQLTGIAHLDPRTDLYGRYDAAVYQRELTVFREWVCGHLLGIAPSGLDAVAGQLIASALQQPQRCIHLDYHSRNLIWQPHGDFGLVDFQDARIGPWTYDAVSLLRDCYQRWPEHDVRRWAEQWRNLPANDGCNSDQFPREFDWCGIQRQLKAAGIFVRMHLRDGKPQHLPHVLPTLQRVRDVAAGWDDLASLTDWLDGHVIAAVRRALACG